MCLSSGDESGWGVWTSGWKAGDRERDRGEGGIAGWMCKEGWGEGNEGEINVFVLRPPSYALAWSRKVFVRGGRAKQRGTTHIERISATIIAFA